MTYVKMWGQKRTGTNWLAWLLTENFSDVAPIHNIFGWKHAVVPVPDLDPGTWSDPNGESVTEHPEGFEEMHKALLLGEIRHACIVKNPYAWAVSIARLLEPAGQSVPIDSIVNLWNASTANYLRGRERGYVLLRYEDLLQQLDVTLQAAGTEFGLSPKRYGESFRTTETRTRAGGDGMSLLVEDGDPFPPRFFRPFDASYYVEEEYLEVLTGELLGAMRETLDRDVMKELGYEVK